MVPGSNVPHNKNALAFRPASTLRVHTQTQAQDEAIQLLEETLAASPPMRETSTGELERMQAQMNAMLKAERAESKLEKERSAHTIETLMNLLRLCKEDVKSEELRRQIDDACPPRVPRTAVRPFMDVTPKHHPFPATRDLPQLEVDSSAQPSASQSQYSGISAPPSWNPAAAPGYLFQPPTDDSTAWEASVGIAATESADYNCSAEMQDLFGDISPYDHVDQLIAYQKRWP